MAGELRENSMINVLVEIRTGLLQNIGPKHYFMRQLAGLFIR
jgi:hypothetical protein